MLHAALFALGLAAPPNASTLVEISAGYHEPLERGRGYAALGPSLHFIAGPFAFGGLAELGLRNGKPLVAYAASAGLMASISRVRFALFGELGFRGRDGSSFFAGVRPQIVVHLGVSRRFYLGASLLWRWEPTRTTRTLEPSEACPGTCAYTRKDNDSTLGAMINVGWAL